MEKYHFGKKCLAVGIVLFFVGLSMLPISVGLSIKRSVLPAQVHEMSLQDDNDTTPPVTTISFDPPIPNGLAGWYISDVRVTLNATDNESGVWKTFCSLLPPGEVYTEPILITQDGIYFIYFCSVDYAGNVELPKSAAVKIDQTPPVLILNYTWGGNFWEGYWISVSVICYDTMSGTNKVEFYLNEMLQETVTGPGPEYLWTYQWAPLPNATIKVIAYDEAGNSNSAEIVNPHSLYSSSQLIRNILLSHQAMTVSLPGLMGRNQ